MIEYRMESPRAKHLHSMTSQLVADVVLYPTEAGGRKIPAELGWGFPCCPSKSLPLFGVDAWPLLGDTPLLPGERRRIGFVFLGGEKAADILRKAGMFYLWEGRFVGEAVVVAKVKNFAPLLSG